MACKAHPTPSMVPSPCPVLFLRSSPVEPFLVSILEFWVALHFLADLVIMQNPHPFCIEDTVLVCVKQLLRIQDGAFLESLFPPLERHSAFFYFSLSFLCFYHF